MLITEIQNNCNSPYQFDRNFIYVTLHERKILLCREFRVKEMAIEAKKKKLVIVGDGACGKSCLLIVFTKGSIHI